MKELLLKAARENPRVLKEPEPHVYFLIFVDEHLRTSIPGVYAGGDCVSLGQDLTVQAVQHGKLAAEAMHAQLMLNVEAA